ncbi:MAG: type II toxin-antitoxin system HicB family antitoxin [Deltaproteobacteria bacterium]|nr:type II toxin-antitoxin system HicB family antitoxin [Deltaproteobacteria bacterium]
MRLQLTAVFEKVPLGYIAYVEELPGANTQGRTLEEARSNLFEAVEMTMEANRNLFEEEINDKVMIKEPFAVLTA